MGLGNSSAELQTKLTRMKHSLGQRDDEIRALRREIEMLTDKVSARDRELENTRSQAKLRDQLRAKLGEREASIRELEAELGKLKLAADKKADPLSGRVRELELALSAREARLKALQHELDARDRRIRELKSKGQGEAPGGTISPAQLAQVRSEIEALTVRLAERERRITTLEQEKVEAAGSAELAKSRAEAGEVAALASKVRELEAEKAQLNQQLDARQETINKLEHDLADNLAWGNAEAGAPADDLTRIKGIGPKYARKLNELGVTKISQVAAWKDEDIARFAAQLKAAPGRIRKAGWVESAKQLAQS